VGKAGPASLRPRHRPSPRRSGFHGLVLFVLLHVALHAQAISGPRGGPGGGRVNDAEARGAGLAETSPTQAAVVASMGGGEDGESFVAGSAHVRLLPVRLVQQEFLSFDQYL